MKINSQSSNPATPIAIDDSELAPVSGGIWGGPDGTWRCDGTRAERGSLRLRSRGEGDDAPALPPTVVSA